jgi:hypothetical protein
MEVRREKPLSKLNAAAGCSGLDPVFAMQTEDVPVNALRSY